MAEIFSKKTGLKVYPVRKMFRHPLYPFMLADVDFFIDFPDGSKGILECKTTNYNCMVTERDLISGQMTPPLSIMSTRAGTTWRL